ncbi:hypothetical protein [Adhaeribacter aerolatus]|nr:hypothetical protein [Adhaeribacter aerolatus]
MGHLIIGSLLLSLIHAVIPNHWLPILVISRAENWSRRELLGITALTAFFHVLSTIIIGVSLGVIGYKLSESHQFFTTILAPVILILMGCVYVVLDLKQVEHQTFPGLKQLKQKSKPAIIFTLCLAMLFSPCLEIDTYFITAGAHGWQGIAAVAMVYFTVTISGLVLLVALAYKGMAQFNFSFLEQHHKKITGLVLILLGLFTFYQH